MFAIKIEIVTFPVVEERQQVPLLLKTVTSMCLSA